MASSRKKTSFDDLLQELTETVTRLEDTDVPLEESLKAFERGMALTREAQALLSQAEQKVQLLIEEGGQPVAQALPEDGE